MKIISKLMVFVLCLTVILASFALAANTQTYTLDELYMQVSIPTELAVFTRNIAVDDPNLAIFGADKQSMEEYYSSNNIYLNAISVDSSSELIVTMTADGSSHEAFNFNLYDDTELKALESDIRDEFAKTGIDLTGYSTYQGATAKFIVMDTTAQTSEGESMCRRQFYTVYNGQAIHITLNSYTGKLTSELEVELQSVVDSVVFTQTLPTPGDNLKLKSTKFWNSLPNHAASRLIISGVTALIVAAVFAIRHLKKKKKSKSISNNNDI